MGVKGIDAHLKNLDRVGGAEMVRAVGQRLYVSGQNLAVDAQLSITDGAKSGRIYEYEFRTINGHAAPIKALKRSSPHQASAPGEPPADDSGKLAENIEAVQIEPLKTEVSSNMPYARHLEFGTSKMLARPYMQPAADRARKKIDAELAETIRTVVRKR